MPKIRYWVVTRVQDLQAWIGKRYEKQLKLVEQEAKERSARNELALFAHPMVRFGVFLAALTVFIVILQFTTPPRGLKKILVGKSVVYSSKAELCFGDGCLNNPEKIHEINLPYLNIEKLPGYVDRDLYYRFKFDSFGDSLRNGFDSFFVQFVWGDAEIYRSGNLIASGRDFWPIIPLEKPTDEVVVRVKSPSGQKFGIRGIVSPFISERSFARIIEKELSGEPFQIQYSFVAQLAGLCLLLVMFLTFPYRPELFAFLVLFGVETLRAKIHYISEEGGVLLTPGLDKLLYSTLLVAGVLSLVFFVGTFFRRSIYKIIQDSYSYLGRIVASVVLVYVGLTTLFPSLDGDNALFIALWGVASFASVILVRRTMLLLFRSNAHARLALGVVALLGVAYWAIVNVRDHFVLTSEITSVYSNHLHFFFFMAVVLGIEIGRTEIKIKEAFSLLPKEVIRSIHDKQESWREGFVILLDMVGWTQKLKQLTEAETPIYIKKVNEYLLSFFDEPDVSVINSTGDGFFLTFEGGLTEGRFLKLKDACTKLALSRPRLESLGIELDAIKNDQIIVRSAIGYGRYYIGFVQTKYVKKEFLAGFLATFLSRVIGNDPNPTGPRILIGSDIDKFRDSSPVLSEEMKTEKMKYWLAS